MSTKLKATKKSKSNLPKLHEPLFAITVAEWNSHITEALLQGALDVFKREGYKNIIVKHVPGTVELTYAAARMIDIEDISAVIVIGCVIRGDTPHFDYVCQSVTAGVAQLNSIGNAPIIFGVLTTENEQQALDRAGGALGNKGAEAAEAAIKMADFTLSIEEQPLARRYTMRDLEAAFEEYNTLEDYDDYDFDDDFDDKHDDAHDDKSHHKKYN